MTDYDSYVLIAAVYDDADDAVRDFDAVKFFYDDRRRTHDLDAAVIQKKDDGGIHVVKKHEQSTRTGGRRGAGVGLAIGAVIALFPAAAIGAGLVATTTAGGAALGAVAGHVAKGLSRHDLDELGAHLDVSDTGLIVIAAEDVGAHIEETLLHARRVVSKNFLTAASDLAAAIAEAERDAPSDDRTD